MKLSYFFEKMNKIDNPLARLTEKKVQTQITKIENERGQHYQPHTNKKVVLYRREYYEQLYANRFNFDEIDKFLERHKLPKLTQEEAEKFEQTL